ncbi:AMP-binding protein [Nocardia tengchongensis]
MIPASTTIDHPLTLTAVVDRAEGIHARKEVVSCRPDGTLARTTMGQCAIRARRLAAALAGLGVGVGDRVATLLWNQAEHLEVFFAVPAMGAVLHALDPGLPANELVDVVADAGDRIIIVDESLLGAFAGFRRERCFEHVIVVGHGWPVRAGMLDYEAVIAAAHPMEWPVLDERQTAALSYSCRGDERPTGTSYSHRALMLHTLTVALADELRVSVHDTLLPVLPMFQANAFGAFGLPYAAALIGARLVLPGPRKDPVVLLNLLAAERVTASVGDPAAWVAVLAALDAVPRRWDLRGLDRLIVVGSMLNRSVFAGYGRHGLRISQAWGMTEPIAEAGIRR